MYFSSIEIGDKVEIKYVFQAGYTAGNGNLGNDTYLSEVSDVFNDRSLDIVMPIKDGMLVALQVGKRYDIFVNGEKGMYHFQAIATGRAKRGRIPVLSLDVEGEVEKLQRRDFFRFKKALDVSYRVLKKNEVESALKLDKVSSILNKHGVTIDISAGGLKFITGEELSKGEMLLLELEIPSEKADDGSEVVFNPRRDGGMAEKLGRRSSYMYSIFEVVACDLNERGYYEARGNYSQIDKKDVDKIVRYIFLLERRLRKRELEQNE